MVNDVRVQVAGRLRRAREASGLSQAQVAQKLGLHRPAVSEIEAGRRRVTAEEATQLADLYGVSVEWVMTGEVGGSTDADERLAVVARQLSKMTDADLDRLMNLLKMLRPPGADRDV
jgi:transcriptional regulator with XRE-family HTH domain